MPREAGLVRNLEEDHRVDLREVAVGYNDPISIWNRNLERPCAYAAVEELEKSVSLLARLRKWVRD